MREAAATPDFRLIQVSAQRTSPLLGVGHGDSGSVQPNQHSQSPALCRGILPMIQWAFSHLQAFPSYPCLCPRLSHHAGAGRDSERSSQLSGAARLCSGLGVSGPRDPPELPRGLGLYREQAGWASMAFVWGDSRG